MLQEKIRIGIIGANAHYGWSMRAHLPALLALPEYELTAVCTAHRETAEESAQHYGAVASVHVASVPWHGSGWRMEVYGREATLVASSKQMVQYAHIQLLGGKGQDAALEELSIPDRLTWIPAEVPTGPPFNVAQLYRRLSTASREGTEAQPDFDLAVRRHRLLEAIQHASDQGAKAQVP